MYHIKTLINAHYFQDDVQHWAFSVDHSWEIIRKEGENQGEKKHLSVFFFFLKTRATIDRRMKHETLFGEDDFVEWRAPLVSAQIRPKCHFCIS